LVFDRLYIVSLIFGLKLKSLNVYILYLLPVTADVVVLIADVLIFFAKDAKLLRHLIELIFCIGLIFECFFKNRLVFHCFLFILSEC
jgi:hypothetical protein